MLLFSLLISAALQRPVPLQPPRLINRAEVLKLRRDIEKKYLKPSDSVLVRVSAVIDTTGAVRDPYALDKADSKMGAVAVLYVRRMRFQPAMDHGRKRSVILKIPVVFKR